MKTQPSKERAESRVVSKYHKLYKPLIELVDALQDLEPGGTLVDDIILEESKKELVHITYAAKPISLTIKDKSRLFVLRVADNKPD